MLKVELACQEFKREDGETGKIAWPIKDLTEEQLQEIMSIPGVWTPNTRKVDQLDGVAIWACKNVLLLRTVLQSWRKKEWAQWMVECLKSDPDCKRGWELRTIWTEDLNQIANEEDALELTDVVPSTIELTEVVEEPNFVILPHEPTDVEALRENRRNHAIVKQMFRRIHSEAPILSVEEEEDSELTSPFSDLGDEEVEILVSNLGQEDTLW